MRTNPLRFWEQKVQLDRDHIQRIMDLKKAKQESEVRAVEIQTVAAQPEVTDQGGERAQWLIGECREAMGLKGRVGDEPDVVAG